VVLSEIFANLGGVWNTIAQHFPFVYSRGMITSVVHSSLVSGTAMARVEPGSPSATASLIAIAIYGGVLLAAMVVAVRVRDVTA
jgi:hypothetical protein